MIENLHHVSTLQWKETVGDKIDARKYIRQDRNPAAPRGTGIVAEGARSVQHTMITQGVIGESVVVGVDLPKVVLVGGHIHEEEAIPLTAGTAAKAMMTPLSIAVDADGHLLWMIDDVLEEDDEGTVVEVVTHRGPHDLHQLQTMSDQGPV